jgi:hypothetical protein
MLEAAFIDDADVIEDRAVAEEIARKKLVDSFGGTDVREGPALLDP